MNNVVIHPAAGLNNSEDVKKLSIELISQIYACQSISDLRLIQRDMPKGSAFERVCRIMKRRLQVEEVQKNVSEYDVVTLAKGYLDKITKEDYPQKALNIVQTHIDELEISEAWRFCTNCRSVAEAKSAYEANCTGAGRTIYRDNWVVHYLQQRKR